MRSAICVLMMMLGLAGALHARDATKPSTRTVPQQPQETAISPSAVEPAITSQIYVGEPAPDFELDGSLGRPERLSRLKGYWILLVFSDTRSEVAPIKEIEPDLRKLGVKPYAVCADKAHVLKAFAEKMELSCVLLSDVTGEISQLYGLYDLLHSRIRPGFVLINRQGVVDMALLGQMIPMEDILGLVHTAVTGGSM